jgi:hypothetical protein
MQNGHSQEEGPRPSEKPKEQTRTEEVPGKVDQRTQSGKDGAKVG